MAALSHLFRLLCVRLGGARARLCAAQFPQLLQRRLNRSGPPRPTRYKNTTGLRRHVNNHTITLRTPTRRWLAGWESREKTLKSACRIGAIGSPRAFQKSSPRADSRRKENNRALSAAESVFGASERANSLTKHTFLTTHFRLFVATSASQRLHLGVKTHKTRRKLCMQGGHAHTISRLTLFHWYFVRILWWRFL